MALEACDCQTAKHKHLLITLEDEEDFKDELEFIQFNFCPFCGEKVERKKKTNELTEEGLRRLLEMRGACSRASCD